MKKVLVLLLVFLLFPLIVMADVEDDTTTSTTTTTTSETIETSPDTGVEDYFLTLAGVSISLRVILYILNKKNVFQEI